MQGQFGGHPAPEGEVPQAKPQPQPGILSTGGDFALTHNKERAANFCALREPPPRAHTTFSFGFPIFGQMTVLYCKRR